MKLARFALVLLCTLLLAGLARAQFGGPPKLQASLVAETTAIQAGQPFTVGVRYQIDPEWHIYWQSPGDSGLPPTVEWELPAGFTAGPLQFPLPTLHQDGDLVTNVLEGDVLLLVQITPPAQLPAGPVTLKAKLAWLTCSRFCIPGKKDVQLQLAADGPAQTDHTDLFAKARQLLPQTEGAPEAKWDGSDPAKAQIRIAGLGAAEKAEFYPRPPEGAAAGAASVSAPDAGGVTTITFPITTPAPAEADWRGLLVVRKGEARVGWYLSASGRPVTDPAPTAGPASATEPDNSAPSTAPGASSGGQTPPPLASLGRAKVTLLSVIGLAFVGGLILNVMPCVLPVISLKIFGFVRQAGQDPGRVFRLGLAFVAGVFTFFLGLATIAAVLHASGRSLSWGSQFQNPFLLTGLIVLTFVFGLNLLGVFEITLAGGATSTLSELSSREGYGGAFLHGMFTTLLGTSCTAPILAGSIGYAVTQPAPIIFLLFATVALGMSLPYFLLTAFPSWMKFLPKPGVWMERFKQVTGFFMLAVAVWLFSVMAGSRPDAATHLSWYLLALGLACWMFGAFSSTFVRWIAVPLIAIAGYYGIVHGSLQAKLTTTGSNLDQRVADARKTGHPVFVDFTADWCANCKTYEKFVLKKDTVQAAFEEKKIVTVVADWTNPDPEIEQWLARFGRAGVPLYLLYRPGEEEPIVMDAITSGSLLNFINTLPASTAAPGQTTVQR